MKKSDIVEVKHKEMINVKIMFVSIMSAPGGRSFSHRQVGKSSNKQKCWTNPGLAALSANRYTGTNCINGTQ